jgi:hypothetical protein
MQIGSPKYFIFNKKKLYVVIKILTLFSKKTCLRPDGRRQKYVSSDFLHMVTFYSRWLFTVGDFLQ